MIIDEADKTEILFNNFNSIHEFEATSELSKPTLATILKDNCKA